MRYFWCELAIVSAFMITFAVEFNSLTIINIRTMVNYKDLGLVNTRDMFAKAIKGGYAIPAFNFNNMEQMQAIIKAAVELSLIHIFRLLVGRERNRFSDSFF